MGIRARFLMPNRGGGASYSDKVLGYSPIAYWMLAEASGTDAICKVNAAQNGSHTGVTLGQTGIGDGETCPLYDGLNDYTDIYSVTLDAAFNGRVGTLAGWVRVSGAGVWTDAAYHTPALVYAGGSNYAYIYKIDANNTLRWGYAADGTVVTVEASGQSWTDWRHMALVWDDVTADSMWAYLAGSQVGATQTPVGTWAGVMESDRTLLGAQLKTPVNPWDGWLAHWAIWDRALGPADIADLAVV